MPPEKGRPQGVQGQSPGRQGGPHAKARVRRQKDGGLWAPVWPSPRHATALPSSAAWPTWPFGTASRTTLSSTPPTCCSSTSECCPPAPSIPAQQAECLLRSPRAPSSPGTSAPPQRTTLGWPPPSQQPPTRPQPDTGKGSHLPGLHPPRRPGGHGAARQPARPEVRPTAHGLGLSGRHDGQAGTGRGRADRHRAGSC